MSSNKEQIENAILELVSSDFLVQTGRHGDVLFVANPRLAHTLGVMVQHPDRYGDQYTLEGQLLLPFRTRNIAP